MNTKILLILVPLLIFSSTANARRNKNQFDNYLIDTEPLSMPSYDFKYQEGYIRKDGTYVSPHYKTKRNNTKRDNYTTYPNVNPWTGKKGYKKSGYNYY